MIYSHVVERQKEGYESDVEDIGDIAKEEEDESDESDYHGQGSDSDDSFTAKSSVPGSIQEKSHQTRSSDRRKQTAQKSTTGWAKSATGSLSEMELPDLDVSKVEELKKIETINSPPQSKDVKSKKRRTGRSTGARYGSINPSKKEGKEAEEKETDDSFHGPSTRDFYKDEQSCYIMDAKSMGDIGRYLDHSCYPCAFVQNVFVDTHDLRFPWIAFFAGQYISAGTELT